MKLYFIYHKSPKKCRELEDIVSDLENFFEFDDGGVRPVRASESRWISHKLNAMKRVLSKYGAYTKYLTALSEDSSLKSVDRVKLLKYCRKWIQGKYVIGCAIFIDSLVHCAIFSKVMQFDEIDILGVLTSLLKIIKETDKLKSKSLEEWPTIAGIKKKFRNEDGKVTYQNQELSGFDERYYTNKYQDYCSKVTDCIKSRLAWFDVELMRDIIHYYLFYSVILSTQGRN